MELKARSEEQAAAALGEEIREALGPERYAEYERVLDADYKILLRFADRFDMSQETVRRVHDVKRAAERQREALEANPNITEEQRAAALAAIARESQEEAAKLMGKAALDAYRRSAGDWLINLAVPPPPLPVENLGQ
jgi:hypothetical protein